MTDATVTEAVQKAKEANGRRGGRQRGLSTGAARATGEEDGKQMLAGAEKGDPGRGELHASDCARGIASGAQ